MGILERAEANLKRDSSRAAQFDPPQENLTVICASNIKPEPIQWLWSGWLARGKLHVLAGSPGTGKTTLAIALAGVVTSGSRWPDGTPAEQGNVLIWSGEDDPRDTLLPRLLAAEGDRDKTFFIAGVTGEHGERAFDPARDVDKLESRIKEIGNVRLLIVDPIVNAVAGDSHKNTEVRRALAPLVELAQKHDIAVLGISHFSKGTGGREPLERVTGSLAFGALARIVLVAAKGKAENDTEAPVRLFARAKSNIGPDDGGFEYLIEYGPAPGFEEIETSWVRWIGPIEGSARDLLASAEPDDIADHGSLGDGKEFLRDCLRDGPKPVKAIQKAAGDAGHAWATIKRAKRQLGVDAVKTGMEGGWEWVLPAEGAQAKPKALNKKTWASSGQNERLRDQSDDWEPL